MTRSVEESDATGRYADAAGTRVHYGVVGDGAPLVLLHGGGPGANGWNSFRRNIDVLSASFRVYVPDLPQFGRSDKPYIASNRLSFWAASLHAFMRDVGIQSAHYVGNSMGGQAALKLAIDYPEDVRSLAVIAPVPVRGSVFSPMPAEAIRLIIDYYKGAGPSHLKMETLIRSLVWNQALITPEIVEARFKDSISPDLLELHQHPEPPKQSLDAELARISCPTLILWGKDDRAAPLDVAFQLMMDIRDSEVHVFGNCGHWVQVEHCDAFNQLVRNFAERADRARAG